MQGSQVFIEMLEERVMSKVKVVTRSELMSCDLGVQQKQKFIIILRIPLRPGERHRLCTMYEMRLRHFIWILKERVSTKN